MGLNFGIEIKALWMVMVLLDQLKTCRTNPQRITLVLCYLGHYKVVSQETCRYAACT